MQRTSRAIVSLSVWAVLYNSLYSSKNIITLGLLSLVLLSLKQSLYIDQNHVLSNF